MTSLNGMSDTVSKIVKQALVVTEQGSIDVFIHDLPLGPPLATAQKKFKNYANDSLDLNGVYGNIVDYLYGVTHSCDRISRRINGRASANVCFSQVLSQVRDMATDAAGLPIDYSSDYQTPAKDLTNAINQRIAELSGADGIVGTRNEIEKVRQALSDDVDKIIKDSQAIGADVKDLVVKYLKDYLTVAKKKTLKEKGVTTNLSVVSKNGGSEKGGSGSSGNGGSDSSGDGVDNIKVLGNIENEFGDISELFNDMDRLLIELGRLYQKLAEEQEEIMLASAIEYQIVDFVESYGAMKNATTELAMGWTSIVTAYQNAVSLADSLSDSDWNSIADAWAGVERLTQRLLTLQTGSN